MVVSSLVLALPPALRTFVICGINQHSPGDGVLHLYVSYQQGRME